MKKSKLPEWVDTDKLSKAAASELKANAKLTVNLPDNFRKISSYKCELCYLPFTSGQIEPQLKRAARDARGYVECPKCSGYLKEISSAIVRDTQPLASRADRQTVNTGGITRSPNTWIDKAIYGKLIQAVATYVASMGVMNPQLKFQRGIRTAKFPGEPMSAKGAEFTVEFTDYNNTRNRFVVQAGLDEQGKFIYPRTFSTLSGNEYPLTALAVEDFVSGKVYEPVVPDHTIPPLNYRDSDLTRFREISANTKRLVKLAMDPTGMGMPDSTGLDPGAAAAPVPPGTLIPEVFTDPTQAKEQLRTMGITPEKYPMQYEKFVGALMDAGSGGASDNMGQVPTSQPGNFMNGVGLGKRAMQDIMMDAPIEFDVKTSAIKEAIDQGLTFEETYNQVKDQTGFPVTLVEYDMLGQNEADRPEPILASDIANRLLATAEVHMAATLQVTAEDVRNEFNTSEMATAEADEWVDKYVDVYNHSLEEGTGVVEARRRSLVAAQDMVAEIRVKLALRDKSTLVPFTDPDPEYSLAQQTQDSEARFDVKYDGTDGGIPPFEERNISTMFREKVDNLNPTVDSEASTLGLKKKASEYDEVSMPVRPDPANGMSEDPLSPDAPFEGGAPQTELNFEGMLDQVIQNFMGAGMSYQEAENFLRNTPEGQRAVWNMVSSVGAAQKIIKQAHCGTCGVCDCGKEMDPGDKCSSCGSIAKKAAFPDFNPYREPVDAQGEESAQLAGEYENTVHDIDAKYDENVADINKEYPEEAASRDPYMKLMEHVRAMAPGVSDKEISNWLQSTTDGLAMYHNFMDENKRANMNKNIKRGEATGTELEPDEVGQNPINMSRLKTLVQDYLRAGNIPPTKVDLHKLKDGGYTMDELKALVKTVQTGDDAAIYPTTHASVTPERLRKGAEDKLADMFKEMPLTPAPPAKAPEPSLGESAEKESQETKPEPEKLKGGVADGMPSSDFDPAELAKGIDIEMEHIKGDREVAEEIAKDHLAEIPDYYTRLTRMEDEAKSEKIASDMPSLMNNLLTAARNN